MAVMPRGACAVNSTSFNHDCNDASTDDSGRALAVVHLRGTVPALECALTPLPLVKSRHREEADAYPAIVAKLNSTWRVIECRDRIQWILQRRAGKRHGQPRWDGRCYCRTRDGLLRRVRELASEIEPVASAFLKNLPDWIGGQP
jgi:hypothetical protein